MNDNEKQANPKHEFELNLREQNISEKKLLDDLRRVALEYGQGKVSLPLYEKHGKYSFTTLTRRFGSWNEALKRANLAINNEVRISDIRLFENLENVWVRLGKQPRRRDMVKPISQFSEGPYNNRFGSWNKALQAFIDYVNEVGANPESTIQEQDDKTSRRTSRDVNLRLRFRVMRRDNFKCKNCGRSPATDPEVVLHIDHVVAWSKGGETEIENLQTSCSKCNLGKGTLDQSE